MTPDTATVEKKKKKRKKKAVKADSLYGLKPAVVDAVAAAARAGDAKRVRRLIHPLHFSDVADLLERLKPDVRRQVVDYTRRTLVPEVFAELDESVREEVVEQLETRDIAAAVHKLSSDDAVELLEDLDAATREEVLDAVDEENREAVQIGLSFPEDSAGRLMQTDHVAVSQFWTVGETIDHMREADALPDDFYDIFVTDAAGKLVGIVPLNRLLRSRRPVRVRQIMLEDVTVVPAAMDQEEAAMLFRQRDLVSAPVVDDAGRLVGMITVDDIVDVIDEEATEDLLRLSGLSRADFYQDTLATTRARFRWLGVNLITAIAASAVIAIFARTIEQVVALAVLMPIVASMGGNAGTQTLTVTVRAIALRDIGDGAAARFVAKELLVGLINGVLFAILMGGIAWLWFASPVIAAVIGAAMILNLIVAGAAGALIPVSLDRWGIDPAVGSTVILTTVTDIVGFLVFLGFATIVLT